MGVVHHGRTATSRGSRLPGRRDGARASPHYHRPRRVVQVTWVQGAPSSPAATPSPSLPGAPLLLASPPSPSLPAPGGGSSPPPLPSSWRVLYHAACSRSRMDAQPRGSVLAGASSSAPASAEALDIHERRRAAANLAALLPDCAVAQLLGSSVPLVLARSSQSVADSVITVLASWSSPTLRGVLYSLQGIMEYCGSRDIPMGDHEIDGSVTQDFLRHIDDTARRRASSRREKQQQAGRVPNKRTGATCATKALEGLMFLQRHAGMQFHAQAANWELKPPP
ncbi:hypothetical protein RI054_06g32170 [Pseudoscourfieldia marina]